jgi:integrase/recombinase XerD
MSRRGTVRPSRPKSTIFLALDDWPEADRASWEHALRQGDMGDNGIGADWRPPTVTKFALDYGRWLLWLGHAHSGSISQSPWARITVERVTEYAEHLKGCRTAQGRALAPQSVASHLLGLGKVAGALAGNSDYSWIVAAAQRMIRRAVPTRNGHAGLRSPRELVALGFRLMAEADQGKCEGRYPPAVRFRNGLMIALVAYCPIRVKNLAGIHIGGQLQKAGTDFSLYFASDETKQRRPLEIPLPPALSHPLERYIAVYRPTLLTSGPFSGTAGNALWVASDGGPLSKGGIQRVFNVQTQATFGERINIHKFRALAATAVAIEDPANAYVIAAILGHSSMATSERHYNRAQSVDAARDYHGALKVLRRDARVQHKGTPLP